MIRHAETVGIHYSAALEPEGYDLTETLGFVVDSALKLAQDMDSLVWGNYLLIRIVLSGRHLSLRHAFQNSVVGS